MCGSTDGYASLVAQLQTNTAVRQQWVAKETQALTNGSQSEEDDIRHNAFADFLVEPAVLNPAVHALWNFTHSSQHNKDAIFTAGAGLRWLPC